MPAHEQLRRAIGTNARCLAFTNHWMTREIQSLFHCQWTRRLDVLAFHRDFADVMQKRRCLQRTAIVTGEMKHHRELVSDHRDALCVRMLVTLETIRRLRELQKRVASCFVD